MVDLAISVLLSLLLVELARFGGHVSANPPASPTIARGYTRRFRIYAIAAGLLVIAQGVRVHVAQEEAGEAQSGLRGSIAHLQSQVQESETGRRIDNAYLKAKLEDYKELQGLAPALLKMAEASEDYTKKQYEVKVMNDAQLLDFSRDVIGRIRELGGKCKAQEDAIFVSSMDVPSQWQSMNQDQRGRYIAEQTQRRERADTQSRLIASRL
jgi:hypothetical protein